MNIPTLQCLLILSLTLFNFIGLTFAQDKLHASPTREYVKTIEQARYTELLTEYGQHKELPVGYELQALLALSHYPELRDINIRFIIDDLSMAISSRPSWKSLLRSSLKRTYLINIDNNNDKQGMRVLLLKNQPFNAQIGILGHELAHTAYYLNRSFFGLMGDATCQLTQCRIQFERNTDHRLINYGLGWQRYDHSTFLWENSDSPLKPKPGKNINESPYMRPAELLAILKENILYAETFQNP